jgi:aminomethyltransferase
VTHPDPTGDTPLAPTPLALTPLDGWHRRLGARMVPFAGYAMPVQYDLTGALAERCKGGVMAEHLHCRSAAALFDVSHMGQVRLTGPNPAEALERLVPGDILGLKPGRQRYTLLTSAEGGIIDDLMVANPGDGSLFLVVNASRKDVDLAHIAAALPTGTALTPLPDQALLALQGPRAAAVLSRLAPDAATLPFMGVATIMVDSTPCLVSRSGYTGEDGFEISVPADRAEWLADRLLTETEVVPAGLGARDSLRLEAGLCLYGNDIDETTNPIEAGLTWVIGKRRKITWDFPGGPTIRDTLDNGPARLRIGIRPDGRAPARAGTEIVGPDGGVIGLVTSGGFGPSVNGPIAMGYARRDLSGDGTKLSLMVRGKTLPATVVPMPFIPHRYAR